LYSHTHTHTRIHTHTHRWISERRAITQKVRESLQESLGEIRLVAVIGERVRTMAHRITSRSPTGRRKSSRVKKA
jgi:hypothetical protein